MSEKIGFDDPETFKYTMGFRKECLEAMFLSMMTSGSVSSRRVWEGLDTKPTKVVEVKPLVRGDIED